MRQFSRDDPLSTESSAVSFTEVSETHAHLGESPAWDPADNSVWWIDVDGQKLMKTRLIDGATETWDTPEYPGFVVLSGANRPIVGMQTGLFLFDPTRGKFTCMRALDVPNHRFNDACVDGKGRLWASTMAMDAHEGKGRVYRVTPSLDLVCVVEGLTIPNGMCVDLALDRLYYSDSHRGSQMIWTAGLDGETGALDRPGVFACLRDMRGRPDGAAIDSNCNYWIAGVDGAVVYGFSPRGEIVRELHTPNPYPTKPAFVGARGNKMVLTSKGGDGLGGNLHLAELGSIDVCGPAQMYWRMNEA